MVSGDVGRLDEAGRLYVVGRDDEMIVSGGENVYPLEVEKTLNAHDAVREVAVVGVDDDDYGQRLAAFVVLGDGEDATADDLKPHVKQQLAGYKVPRDVTFLDELPRNASGKVVKRELTRRRLADGADGGRGRRVSLHGDPDDAHAHAQDRARRAERGRSTSTGSPRELLGRLHRLPPFSRRVLPVPFALNHPLWIADHDDRPDPAHLPAPGARRPATWRRSSG